jgi:hypothetical protein
MLKELGFSKLSFVTEHLELFPTIPEKPDERELPVPLLAIPATAVRSIQYQKPITDEFSCMLDSSSSV